MAEEETAPAGEAVEEANGADDAEQTEEGGRRLLPDDMFYDYEDFCSRPFVTPESEIPENFLRLSHSFGYDCKRRANLQLLDSNTLLYVAGNLLVLLDVSTREQRYLRSCSGGGVGAITVHPGKGHFVAAEKGQAPNIFIYEYPSLRLHRILRGGTSLAYCFVEFNPDGSLLASLGSAPDYMLTLWNWRQEEVMLSCKAISQEVYRVSFSPYNPELLTSSGSGHIKFWKIASTFTGLKLQGLVGHFGKMASTDIEGYVQLPDGKVVSGSDRGNMLLWDGNAIKVEICGKEGLTCHAGPIQPFNLEDGYLLTMGSDGMIRAWNFESIDAADSTEDSSKFEAQAVAELKVGHDVCLTSLVKIPDTSLWFAQDSNGAIWKVDLCFTVQALDPECLFNFHAGAIQGLDVSPKSHLMATTSVDCSVRVFDFLSNTELTSSQFNQGGTSLCWAPPLASEGGGLLVTGFEDGVVRLLELYDPHGLQSSSGRSLPGDGKLYIKQAFKPHNAPVTAVAYERHGQILATGSSDCTVFFFTAGESYTPIGYVQVPGPVQGLEWSPPTHEENRLLVLCQSGHVVEIERPDPQAQEPTEDFSLPDLSRTFFRFRSIKSRIRRDEEIARRQAVKEQKKKEAEESKEQGMLEDEEDDEEEEEELPDLQSPDTPSPICCGFYSLPGQFWLSMGGFDSGYLYHCKFSEQQEGEEPDQRQDEPFNFVAVKDSDGDPVCSITFGADRQLLFCGMLSGAVRVYLLQPGDHALASMRAHWALSLHDNHYGHLRHLRCSHDDNFLLTAGDDGNIFSFSLLPPDELQRSLRQKAKVPTPRMDFENLPSADNFLDPAADSIVTQKKKQERDRLQREAEYKVAKKRRKLAELQKKYKEVLKINRRLPESVRLTPEELELNPCFREEAERMMTQRIEEVRFQLSWEEERSTIALGKLQDWFRDFVSSVVTVVAMGSEHRITTYRLPTVSEPSGGPAPKEAAPSQDQDAQTTKERKKTRAEAEDYSEISEEEVLRPQVARLGGVKLNDRQEERLMKAAMKADQARAKIEKRKKAWAQIYAERPGEDYEDPLDVQAIKEARENIGELKLKTDKDFTVPRHLMMNSERQTAKLRALEANVREQQTDMNDRIVALRDAKVQLLSELRAQARRLRAIQRCLAPHQRRPPPALPALRPEEAPEKRMECDRERLERYRALRERRFAGGRSEEEEESTRLLRQLEEDMEEREKKREEGEEEEEEAEEPAAEEGAEPTELEKEQRREEETRLLHEQDTLLEQMEKAMAAFDAQLLQLRHQRRLLDWRLTLADLRQLTLYQELLLLQELEWREGSLQEKLNTSIREENSIVSKLEESKELMKLKLRDIGKLQEKEKALGSALRASLGDSNKFEEYLIKVFEKKIKRVKEKEHSKEGEEDEDSDDDWDDDDVYSSSEEEGVDDSFCPAGCDPQLFAYALQLRERRLDLEELLVEERRRADALKEECDALVKKEKIVKNNRKAVDHDLELVNREKQHKMNELDVVVPLRLHQIEFPMDGAAPADMSEALVVDRSELSRLNERIKQLHVENGQQRDLRVEARQHHTRLLLECKDMKERIHELEGECKKLMLMKFGRMVDLEVLQTLSGNRVLEELKLEKGRRETIYAKEIKQWDLKVDEARQALMDITKCNTELLTTKKNLLDETRELEQKLNARQKKPGSRQFEDGRRCEDQAAIRRLQAVVNKQSEQAEALRIELELLNRKGGRVLPPGQGQPPSPSPVVTPTGRRNSEPLSAFLTTEKSTSQHC